MRKEHLAELVELATTLLGSGVVSHSDPEMRHVRKSALGVLTATSSTSLSTRPPSWCWASRYGRQRRRRGGSGPAFVRGHRYRGHRGRHALGGHGLFRRGRAREAVEQAGADLVAKVPPVTNAGRFPKTDFDIDLTSGRVTCPAGQTTGDARPSKDHKGRPATFHFAAGTCATCPLRDRCTSGSGGRTIVVGRHHKRIEAARAAQGQPGTKALLRRRSKVERKIDHLQDLGMRKARYRGRRKTRLQALFAATVANFKRLAVLDWLQRASVAVA